MAHSQRKRSPRRHDNPFISDRCHDHMNLPPVFYLNHCNVDRIWEAWLVNEGRTYVPSQIGIGAASNAPAERSHVFNPDAPTDHTSPRR